METCPNCSTSLDKDYRFCPNCGQTTHLHRFNLAHIGHEAFHALTHADKGILHLLKNLTIRPGVVAREYILEGKRKRYFNPFTFLVIVLGLSVFVNSVFKPYERNIGTNQARYEPNGPASTASESKKERSRNVSHFLDKRANLVAFAAIPLFTLAFWLFFRRSGVNYAEHLVANVLFAGYFQLFATIITLILSLLNRYLSTLNEQQLIFQLIYLPFAYYQFMGLRRWTGYLKAVLATLLALAAWIAFSSGVIVLYISRGG
jgi:predicted nucleic acid-binding Zn ribbon protein